MSLARQVRRAILKWIRKPLSRTSRRWSRRAADSIASPRVAASLFGSFAILAMVIAVAGIGCALALSVRQRTREIGIRASLGADPWDLVRMVIRQGMWLVAWWVSGLAYHAHWR